MEDIDGVFREPVRYTQRQRRVELRVLGKTHHRDSCDLEAIPEKVECMVDEHANTDVRSPGKLDGEFDGLALGPTPTASQVVNGDDKVHGLPYHVSHSPR